MLQLMREKSKIILWVVAVSFIMFMMGVWGADLLSGQRNISMSTIGEVDGRDIGVTEYRSEITTLVQNYRRQNQDREPPEDMRRQFDDQAWDNLVQRTVLQREVQRRRIRATDQEVVTYIRSNPLPMFLQNPAFQTNGQFDVGKYQAALNDPRVDWTWLEDYVRGLLPFEKLRQEIIATVRVTDAEVRDRFLTDSEEVRVTYLAVNPRDFRDTTATPSEAEIDAYYRDHGDEFERVAQATAAYVLFERKASEADVEEVRTRAEEILAEAKGGTDFAELARIYSEDAQTATNGGELQFFRRGMMVPEFEAVAFALAPGQVSEPVKTQFGYHVIKVEERRMGDAGEEEIRARHILLKIEPSQETLTAIYTRAEEFASAARKEGFDKAASEMGLAPTETTPFAKGDFIPGVGMLRRANHFAFDNPVGSVSPVLEGPRGSYVFSLKARSQPGIPPLSEIQKAVSDRILLERQREKARARAAEIASYVRSGHSIEEAAGVFGLEKRETPFFTRSTTVGGIGRGTAFTFAAFALEPGQTSDPVQTSSGFYVIRIDEKKPADESLYATRKELLRQQLQREKSESRFEEYVQDLIAKAEIKDRRGLQAES